GPVPVAARPTFAPVDLTWPPAWTTMLPAVLTREAPCKLTSPALLPTEMSPAFVVPFNVTSCCACTLRLVTGKAAPPDDGATMALLTFTAPALLEMSTAPLVRALSIDT